ncbi:hypothetical protein PBI_PBS1_283 [Bacillus phage PBS1]|uniref:Uncharacterized protein n=1 Tax=Bacillus phage PBS1 TaxID=2884423 RepID=A0A223LDJ1_BPPB1|nr:hypothetical protein FK780_gp164 [Bacillus phage PBS1]ASU00105.1 hypothetical protein PBI_PBS1_283 [Bacillus phage PBS1]BDE75386.1 hypothetical protein [Bacillus phage PBS1]
MEIEGFEVPRVGMLYEYTRFDRNNNNKKYSKIKLVNDLYESDNEILKDIPFEELGFEDRYYISEIAISLRPDTDFSIFKDIFKYDENTVNYIREFGKGSSEVIAINNLRNEFIFVKYYKVLIIGGYAYPLSTDNYQWIGDANIVDRSEDY